MQNEVPAPRTVYFNADVYASTDPFATAIAASAKSVLWVGGDEAAATMAGPLVDAGEDLITPGLATAALELDDMAPEPGELLAAGILHAHVIGTRDRLDAFTAAAGHLRVTAYELGGAPAPGRAAACEAAGAAAALPHPDEHTLPGLFLQVRDAGQLATVRGMLEDDAWLRSAQRARWRLRIDTPLGGEAVAALGRSGLSVTIDPLRHPFPVEALLAAGVQLSFELDARAPWATLRAAVFGTDGTTGRAAFNCATRFVHRAGGDPAGGVLAPGSAAEAVRWHTGPLVVQAADERIAAWSTDPRSGTAGLPDLTPGRDLPELVEVLVDGVRLSR